MKSFIYTVFSMLALMLVSLSSFGQVGKAAAGDAKANEALEMPAAVKNMQGKPGYEAELQKWEDSRNASPAKDQAEAQKAVQMLKAADWKAPVEPQSAKSATEGTPYHNYKGITDPAKAKEAWAKDQAPTTGNGK